MVRLLPVALLLGAIWGAAEPAGVSRMTDARVEEARLSAFSGVFTEAQARRGEAVYRKACAHCHASDLLGERGVPALAGDAFTMRWRGVGIGEMLQTVRRAMPQESPDSLGTAAYVDLISYLLEANGAPAGMVELPSDVRMLDAIVVPDR